MSEHIVKIISSDYITHDVKRFLVEKPKGFTFIPGQATDVSLNRPEWRDKQRPFTFTSLPTWQNLEFMIKIYPEHAGVTYMLGKTNSGAELILHDVFGAIQYKGPGVFIAGGSGITPFISIFRDLFRSKKLAGNKLIYSNKTSHDVIAQSELKDMLKEDYVDVYTRENVIGFLDRRIDRAFLLDHIKDFGQHFYVCGPDKFVKDIQALLIDMGASTESLVVEK